MAWHRTGTISLANGSIAVTGSGTSWIANAGIGEALLAPDGKLYEISGISSDGALTLGSPYLGLTQSGQAYVIVPSQSYIRDLAAQAAALVNSYSALSNTVGQGKFADGALGAPGVSFVGDQDTGLHRSASGEVTLVSNGVAVAKWGPGGFAFLVPAAGAFTSLSCTEGITTVGNTHGIRIESNAPLTLGHNQGGGATLRYASSGNLEITPRAGYQTVITDGGLAVTGSLSAAINASDTILKVERTGTNAGAGYIGANAGYSFFLSNGALNKFGQLSVAQDAPSGAMTLDASGNLLVGVGSGANHIIAKDVTPNSGAILTVMGGTSSAGSSFFCTSTWGPVNANLPAVIAGMNGVTGRSINAGGTINASGADYAEYERNNGLSFAKGDIVGFKADGTLTDIFDDAIRFAIKSTNPSYVGGDTWGSEAQVGKRPEKPVYIAPTYTGAPNPGEKPVEPVIELPKDANCGRSVHVHIDMDATAEDLPEYLDAAEAKAAHDKYLADVAAWETTFKAWQADDDKYQGRVIAAESAHAGAVAQYEIDLPIFEAKLEAARQSVDRIAYSGKVPCNVYDAVPGGYIIATESADGGIEGQFVADPGFAQYKKAVGRVNRILEDGRCEVAVMVH